MLCSINPLSPVRASFFGPTSGGEDLNQSPILPPYIIEQLLRPLPQATGPRDQQSPPPLQSVVTLNDRSGLLEITNQYQTTYQGGREALTSIYGALETSSQSQDATQIARLLEGTAPHLGTFSTSARAVRDVHTRYNLSEYSTIENWLNQLYGRYRASPNATPNATPNPGATESVRVEGLMLGFNLAAINKADATYRTGTAVKLLIEHQARALATQWGGEARSLGLWGTNVAVAGVPEARTAEFRQEVERRVIEFLRTDQALPQEISRQIGSENLRTSDLPGRQALLNNPNSLGLKAGHRAATIDAAHLQPNHPNYIRGQADIEVIRLLTGMAEGEMEARRLGRSVFTGEVPANSPVKGRAGRPLLTTPAILAPGTAPHDVAPLPAPDPRDVRETLPSNADLASGRLRRPGHEAGHSIGQANQLESLLSQATNAARTGDVAEAHRLIGEAMAYMNNPENRPATQQPRSMIEFFEGGYRMSLEQHRFPGVFRLELFPQMARQAFGGERFFIQMAEYRDYWGHNRTHTADAGDSMHRLTMDILVRGYQYHGVEVMTGTQGGDEVFFAIRGQTNDGRQLTDADISRISDYLGTNFNRIFQNVEHHEVTKVPMMPGGRFAGRNYLLNEGRLYVERGAYTEAQLTELRDVIRIAHGQTVDSANVETVESLSKVGQVERLRLWSRVDAASGRVIEIFRPMGETPSGFTEVRIPLSTTVTSAVEVPAGSGVEVVRLAMDRAGQQADEMKRDGFDRPRSPGDPATAGPDPITRIPLTDRLNATRGGRVFLHGGMFAAGDILSEGALQVFTGRGGLGSLDYYTHLISGYAQMATGTFVGDTTGRAAIALRDGRLFIRQGERLVLNQAALRTEYTGLRGAGVSGAGVLGAVLLTELMTRGHIDPGETAWTLGTMGTAMGTTRLAVWGVGATLEATGVIATGTRAALTKHPLTAIAVIAAECLIMKGINRLREGWAREETEASLRGRLGSAMRQLDYAIARNQVVGDDGTVNQAARTEYQNATRAVTDAFGDYMMFRFAHNTDEGRAYLSAQTDLADGERDLQKVLRDWPNLSERIRQNPSQQESLTREAIRSIEGTWGDSAGKGIGEVSRSTELRGALDRRNNARTALQTAERNFQDSVRRRLQAAGPGSFHVPLHQSADGFSSGIRTEPVEIYQQFQNYLTTRMAYADQVHARGPDTAAIEAHYAPAAPNFPSANPLSIRFLTDPQAQPLDQVFDPFRIVPQGSSISLLNLSNQAPQIDWNQTGTFIVPNDQDLFRPRPIETGNPSEAPLFYLAAPGVVRPLQATDTMTAGAVWVYNMDTRRYEMMRDVPVLGNGNGANVIDLSGTPRPVIRQNGPNTVLTVDLRDLNPRLSLNGNH